ncbi:MAG: hypothetical protein GIKADHBN_00175 [Phycisphaerales bacterium]|nr:hypothetical protein [Phycisphaerales bacterium]
MSHLFRSQLFGVMALVGGGFIGSAAQIAHAQPVILAIEPPEGFDTVYVEALSGDGATAVGEMRSVGGNRAFRWSLQDGVQLLNSLPGGTTSIAYGVSGNGSTVVGVSYQPISAVSWAGVDPQALGALPGGAASWAYAISPSGKAVAGASSSPSGTRAVVWMDGGAPLNLGVLPGGTSSSALAISADGHTVGGQSWSSGGLHAFRWTVHEGMTDLGVLPGMDISSAWAVSADGGVMAGSSGLPGPTRAFRWTAPRGMEDLGSLPGGENSRARAMTSDGSTIVGIADIAGASRAFIWTRARGMIDLNVFLQELGADLDGWVLTHAEGISANGLVIAGSGTFQGASRGWLVTGVPPVCDADFDGTGFVDTDDFTAFVLAFEAGTDDADFDGTGFVDTDDFTAFVLAFEAGC